MRSRFLQALALWVVVSTAGACVSPTLPLPPPSATLSLEQDQVVVEGSAIPGSMVFVWNRDLGRGAIVTAEEPDGAYVAFVPGEEGDLIAIWSQLDGEVSPTIERIVPPAR